jgi:NADPH:quinone reductase-like Zn-dependent oxidoreductase
MKGYELNEFGIDNLTLVERDVPSPRPGEVVVKFRAFSLNYRDLMVVRGEYNPRAAFPLAPLSDGAGEIVAAGGEVTKWKVGDRVCPNFAQGWIDGETSAEKAKTALGGGGVMPGIAQEFKSFDEQGVVKFPDHLSYEEAATLPCAAVTAWNALAVSGKLKAGDTVLTLGTGGVSIFALQIAKLFGARVIATSSSDAKLEKLKELGADEVINYKAREDWERAVFELTSKRGVDHIIEVGGSGTLSKSVKAVRHAGHVAVIGVLSDGDKFDPTPILMKGIRMQGIFVGSREMFEDLNRFIGEKQMRPVIDRKFGFGELKQALRYLESGAHFGKVVVTPGK